MLSFIINREQRRKVEASNTSGTSKWGNEGINYVSAMLMILLQSRSFPLREESAGRAKRIFSAFSDSKMTSPQLKLQQSPFFSPFPSQEYLMLWLVLGWCLDLKGGCCWLSRREVGSWFPALPPQGTSTCVCCEQGRLQPSQCNELKGSSFLICNLFQVKVGFFYYQHLISINTDSMERLK